MRVVKTQNGFSLAEVIIVITIIALGLVGIAGLLLQNLQVEGLNKNYLIASMLAQEGIEVVRSVRDENWLISGNEWYTDITDNVDSTFIIDYRGRSSINDAVNFVTDAGANLYLSPNGFYSHAVSTRNTAFSRLITATLSSDQTYILVTADVKWNSRFREQHYIINTTLYNWRGE